MKTRSKALWKYLFEKGVLEGTDEEIAEAKAEYRRQYKRMWKERRVKVKELRPCFTLKEYDLIQKTAKQTGLKPTTFARELLLAQSGNTDFIPNKGMLLQALQYITIVAIELSKNTTDKTSIEIIEKAEKLLLNYLFHRDIEDNPT